MYGKLINGQLVPAPNPLHVNRGLVYNPGGGLYEAAGYRPIMDTPRPEQPEGGSSVCYTSHWEERDGKIVRVWAEQAKTEPAPSEKRELAYNTLPCVEWDGDRITVTKAAQKWQYYAAEGSTARTAELTALISAAKAAIREQYPDEAAQA